MDDLFNNKFSIDEHSTNHHFTSPLGDNDFFSLIPEKTRPSYYAPIIDEENGLCIGYIRDDRSGLYDVYDYNGYFVSRMEVPLEHPWLDPLDIIFIGAIIYKTFRFGIFSFKALTQRGLFVEFSSKLGEHTITLLRGRMKAGLSPESLKFTRKAAAHMAERERYVPVYIQERAIRFGKRMPDSVGRSSMRTARYEIGIRRSRYNNGLGSYENKDYTLEVIVNEETWTITHFAYKALR